MLRLAFAALLMTSGQAWAEYLLPTASLQPYADFRAALVSAGFEPVEEHAGDVPDPSKYPELRCYNAGFCTAQFASPPESTYTTDTNLLFTIWRDDSDPAQFRVVPDQRTN